MQVEDEAPEVREGASNNPWAWRPNSHVRLWTQHSAYPVPEAGAVVLMEDLLPACPGGESAHVPAGAGDCRETSWDPAPPVSEDEAGRNQTGPAQPVPMCMTAASRSRAGLWPHQAHLIDASCNRAGSYLPQGTEWGPQHLTIS